MKKHFDVALAQLGLPIPAEQWLARVAEATGTDRQNALA
jgi:hypothetical protein